MIDPDGRNPTLYEHFSDFFEGFIAPGPPPQTPGGALGWATREILNNLGFDLDACAGKSKDFLSDGWEAYYKRHINPNWRWDTRDPYYPGLKYRPGEYYWESPYHYDKRMREVYDVISNAK
jgi:hypothetical protein